MTSEWSVINKPVVSYNSAMATETLTPERMEIEGAIKLCDVLRPRCSELLDISVLATNLGLSGPRLNLTRALVMGHFLTIARHSHEPGFGITQEESFQLRVEDRAIANNASNIATIVEGMGEEQPWETRAILGEAIGAIFFELERFMQCQDKKRFLEQNRAIYEKAKKSLTKT